ncbi:hypothetical protein FOA52_009733 [Chlamydomonas sp. UWO 241]|nr:hypothetical protein FOA52_009733 [Chlamydomonas sp. UWO 241]
MPRDRRGQAEQRHEEQEGEATGSGRSLMHQASSAAGAARSLLSRLAPFGLQMFVSSIAYGGGLAAVQIIGAGLRMSCATPLLGPALGAVGVGAASVLSGHAARVTHRHFEAGGGLRGALSPAALSDFDLDEMLLDALSGLVLFKFVGGQFRRLLPSDLRAPGAFAHHSVPLSAAKHATDMEKGQLISLFKRDGCHHCGSKRGPVIGDHIPPTKLVKVDAAAAVSSSALLRYVRAMLPSALLGTAGGRQAYYAQCTPCCRAQSNLMRHGRRSPLVLHRWLVPPGLLPGVLVGFRQHYSSLPGGKGGGGAPGGGGGGRGSNGGGGRSRQEEDVAQGGARKGRGLWGWVTRMEDATDAGAGEGAGAMMALPAP